MSPVAGVTLDLIDAHLGPLGGRSVLDVGCGGGALARALLARGARVTGIDPEEGALATARARAPEARFEQAGAEALPFPDDAFDGVVMLNSLHHVPPDLMRAALREAARVSRGDVLVIEPLAQGPFFRAMRPVEDETVIRLAAQQAIAGAVAEGDLMRKAGGDYEDVRRFADADAFLAMVVAVDPRRAVIAERVRDEVTALVAEVGIRAGTAIMLPQPHRFDLLARP